MDQDREERIRTRAYEIWEREGRQEGGHEAHWQQAEQELHGEETEEREQDDQGSGQTGAVGESSATPAESDGTGGTKAPAASRKKT